MDNGYQKQSVIYVNLIMSIQIKPTIVSSHITKYIENGHRNCITLTHLGQKSSF